MSCPWGGVGLGPGFEFETRLGQGLGLGLGIGIGIGIGSDSGLEFDVGLQLQGGRVMLKLLLRLESKWKNELKVRRYFANHGDSVRFPRSL